MSFTNDEKKAIITDIKNRAQSTGNGSPIFRLSEGIRMHCEAMYGISGVKVLHVGSHQNEDALWVECRGVCIEEDGVSVNFEKCGVRVDDRTFDNANNVLSFIWDVRQTRLTFNAFRPLFDDKTIATDAHAAGELYKSIASLADGRIMTADSQIGKGEPYLIRAVFNKGVISRVALHDEKPASLRRFATVVFGYYEKIKN